MIDRPDGSRLNISRHQRGGAFVTIGFTRGGAMSMIITKSEARALALELAPDLALTQQEGRP